MFKLVNNEQFEPESCDMSIRSKKTLHYNIFKVKKKYVEADTPVQTFYYNIKLVPICLLLLMKRT